jgi:1,4-dihydroxy-2-naphthoate octaprenyltransferase
VPKSKLKAWLEIARPFSWTASFVPVTLGAAIAWSDGRFGPHLYVLSLLGALFLQAGTNVVNEVFDVRQGVDTPQSARASKVLVQGRLGPQEAYWGGLLFFALAMAIGAYFLAIRGYVVAILGVVGVLAGYFYTAPPFQYKFRALGVILVFFLMGPLMVLGTYYVVAGAFSSTAFLASLPVGLLVAAILHANEVRDVEDDSRAGFHTLSILLGQRAAAQLYLLMIGGAYFITVALAAGGLLPLWNLLVLLSLPVALKTARTLLGGVRRDSARLARIDAATAQVHLLVGLLLTLAFLLHGALK